VKRLALVGLAIGGLACSSIGTAPAPQPIPNLDPRPAGEPFDPWPITQLAARLAADSLRFSDADAILAGYAIAHPGTPEQREAEFLRILLLLEPANPASSPRAAVRALDGYLAAAGSAPHATEARALRRALLLADSVAASAATQRTAAQAREKAKDDELQRLRDELAKVQEELERIRRRLTRRP
jgi:hypothetical protein